MGEFIRYQSAVPNRRGRCPGVFAMANGLGTEGLLNEADRQWLRIGNANASANYVDPTTAAADCLDLLDRNDIPWTALRTRNPGRIVYEDEVQVVAVPYTHETHWPFRPRRKGIHYRAAHRLLGTDIEKNLWHPDEQGK
ncbi:hypothetical protein [Pseudarthrobacter sp. NPDC058119]|uniref:hypothetical protein n=1 Tax=Pseudarthrobacter sp. NPDC058119 TaxID=3346348 RepID=UPI0036DDD18A